MILRLKSRLVSGLIVSTIGMAAASLASAADTPSTTSPSTGATSTTPSTGATSTTPSSVTTTPSTGASSGMPASGTTSTTTGADQKSSTNDTTMAPRGANPSTTTNAMAGSSGAADSDAKRLFDQLDANHDGMLSLDEFSRATFQQPTK